VEEDDCDLEGGAESLLIAEGVSVFSKIPCLLCGPRCSALALGLFRTPARLSLSEIRVPHNRSRKFAGTKLISKKKKLPQNRSRKFAGTAEFIPKTEKKSSPNLRERNSRNPRL